jgi:membrane protein YqaA with SNARE-associated domain
VLRRLYDWTMDLAAHKRASWGLSAVSFIESSVFPIPPDVLLIPMVLAERRKAWFYALLCTVASVLGGILGYGIGLFAFEQIGQPMLELYGYAEKFSTFQDKYAEWGAWAVFIAGITPFPYKVITILSGVAALNPVVFIVASILARGIRFFLVAGVLWKFGEPMREFIERRLGLLTVVFCALLVGGFVLAKFIIE